MEGDFTSLAALLQTQRKAWIVPNCISPKPHTILAKFANRGITGRIAEKDPPDHVIKTQRPGESNVICLPLFSVLQALNRSRVDYFSLDVEGDELEVLKTIPFDLIDIKVSLNIFLSVEMRIEAVRSDFRRCLWSLILWKARMRTGGKKCSRVSWRAKATMFGLRSPTHNEPPMISSL